MGLLWECRKGGNMLLDWNIEASFTVNSLYCFVKHLFKGELVGVSQYIYRSILTFGRENNWSNTLLKIFREAWKDKDMLLITYILKGDVKAIKGYLSEHKGFNEYEDFDENYALIGLSLGEIVDLLLGSIPDKFYATTPINVHDYYNSHILIMELSEEPIDVIEWIAGDLIVKSVKIRGVK